MIARTITEWRNLVLLKNNHHCSKCDSDLDVEAHHIKQKSLYPELYLDIDNGEPLCQSCHKQIFRNTGREKLLPMRWQPGSQSVILRGRKLQRRWGNYVITIPKMWIEYYEKEAGHPIEEVMMELNGEITIYIKAREDKSNV